MNTCPLCKSTHTELVDTILKNEIVNLYLNDFNIDVSNDIKTDFNLFHCNSCDLKYFDPPYAGNEALYQQLQKFDWYYKNETYEHRYARNHISKNHHVLEIGCGAGHFGKNLNCRHYTGLEFNPNAVIAAQAQGLDVVTETVKEHSEKNKNSYDVVASFQVLEHVLNPSDFIRESLDCLKPGGKLILSMPAEDSWVKYKQNFTLNLPPHHLLKFSDKCLENFADLFSITLLDINHEPLDSYHIPWYLNSLLVYQLNKTLGIKHSLIKRPKHTVSHLLSKLITSCMNSSVPREFQGNGHTVIAVYKK